MPSEDIQILHQNMGPFGPQNHEKQDNPPSDGNSFPASAGAIKKQQQCVGQNVCAADFPVFVASKRPYMVEIRGGLVRES